MRNTNREHLLWLVVGLAAGVAAGLLLAPAPGGDTRRTLQRKVATAGNFFAVSGRHYADYGQDLYNRGRALADEAAEMFDEGRRLIENDPRDAV